jgi:hypothetical protein
MRKAVFTLTMTLALGFTTRAAWADPPAAVTPQPTVSPGLSPLASKGTSLAAIGSTTADSAGQAGAQRDTAPPATVAAVASKPAANLRMLRRIKADAAVLALQPAFKDCYARSDSRASGIVVVRAGTTSDGQVETVEVVSRAGLPLGLAQCVADRVREAHFGSSGGRGVSLLVPARLGP